jgi:hypothetical protein
VDENEFNFLVASLLLIYRSTSLDVDHYFTD